MKTITCIERTCCPFCGSEDLTPLVGPPPKAFPEGDLLECAHCQHVFCRTVHEQNPVTALPGYSIENDEMPEQFRSEQRHVATTEELDAFLERWRAAWKLEHNYLNDVILSGDFDKEEALRCVHASFENGCAHVEHGACIGMSIAIPFAFVRASLVAAKFGVPFCTALHQLYCTDDDHEGCF